MISNDDIDGLAAEYVLGSLPRDERTATAVRMRNDKSLIAAVAAWERRLGPLSHREPGIEPPPDVLAGLLAGLAQRSVSEQASAGREAGAVVALRRKVNRWRWVATSLAASSAALTIALGGIQTGVWLGHSGTEVAVLTRGVANPAADEPEVANGPTFVATFAPRSRTVVLRQVAGRRPPANQTYALWLVEPQAPPRHTLIGLMTKGSFVTSFDLKVIPIDAIRAGNLVVSIESGEQSPFPTGPVVSIGRIEGAR